METSKVFVEDIVEQGVTVRSPFLVVDKSLRETKYGDAYLSLKLADKTGQIEARAWDEAEALATRFEQDDFVAVEAFVDSYRDQLQLRVTDVVRLESDQLDLADFVPSSRWAPEELFAQLQELVEREVKSPPMLRFFGALFEEKKLMRQFMQAPAAKGNHHAYLGGLIEHSLSMTRLGVHLSRHYAHYYPGLINQDLVIAGCVLHDVGKCFELSFGRSFNYTDSGQLVGHIVQGVELVTKIAGKVSPPLPSNMIMQIKHLILSHHGKKEYGSPILPKTAEAMLLHEIDMIDSRMNMYSNIAEEHRGGSRAEEPWSDYQRLFQGSVYLGDEVSTQWAKPRRPDPDALPGPGAWHGSDAARVEQGEPQAGRSSDQAERESELNLDLFPD